MGFNTTVLILNDGLDQIEKNPDEFVRGIIAHMYRGGDFGVGNHANPVFVMPTSHANVPRLYLTWNNSIVEFSSFQFESEFKEDCFKEAKSILKRYELGVKKEKQETANNERKKRARKSK